MKSTLLTKNLKHIDRLSKGGMISLIPTKEIRFTWNGDRKGEDYNMKDLFVKTNKQRQWLDKLYHLEDRFKQSAQNTDELAQFPKENIQELVELGYSAVTLPKYYGGEGLSIYDMVLFQETLASFDGNTALSIGWHLSIVGDLYEYKGWREEALLDYAIEITKGALINRSVSEKITGSPTRGGKPGTQAVRKDGQWVLNGRKSFTTASPVLTHFLTSAWIEEQERIGFFLLDRHLVGLSIDETWDVISMRGTGSHDLVLDNVSVDESKLVEHPTKKRGQFNGWNLHIPACYLGIAQAARDYAVCFSREYTPNSLQEPISQLPNVQQQIGKMDLLLTQARHLIYHVAEVADDEARKDLLANEVAVAKHTVTNHAIEIVDLAMRLVGAQSLGRKNPLQRYYRDVRAGLHNPPMDDMVIQQLAKTALEEEARKSEVYTG